MTEYAAVVAIILSIVLSHVATSKARREQLHKLEQEILQLRLWTKTIAKALGIYLPESE